MLGAEHAERATVLPHRNVQHGADAVRGQIVVEEATRPRIAVCVVGRDDAVGLERLEVAWARVAPDARADFVTIGRSVEEAIAANLLAVVGKAPQAQSLDVERLGGHLQNRREPIVELRRGPC